MTARVHPFDFGRRRMPSPDGTSAPVMRAGVDPVIRIAMIGAATGQALLGDCFFLFFGAAFCLYWHAVLRIMDLR